MQLQRLFVSVLLSAGALVAFSQICDVKGIKRVPTTEPVDQAVISPDGTMAIVSSMTGMSLSRVNLTNGKSTAFTDNAIIHGLKWSDDSRHVYFERPSYDENRLRYKSVIAYDLKDAKERQLTTPERNLNGISVRGNDATIVRNAKVSAINSKGEATKAEPIAYINYGQLMVNANGTDVAINPQGTEGHSYLWPSISPDGSKVLYYHVGTGAHVCDLDGSNVIDLGYIHAMRWLDNASVIGMRDYDDGTRMTSSSIIATDLKGHEQNLTASMPGLIATYPSVSAKGDKVAFTTPTGELYIININR